MGEERVLAALTSVRGERQSGASQRRAAPARRHRRDRRVGAGREFAPHCAAREERTRTSEAACGKLALIAKRGMMGGGLRFGQGRSDRSWGTLAQIFTRRWGRGLAQLYTRGGRVNY